MSGFDFSFWWIFYTAKKPGDIVAWAGDPWPDSEQSESQTENPRTLEPKTQKQNIQKSLNYYYCIIVFFFFETEQFNED